MKSFFAPQERYDSKFNCAKCKHWYPDGISSAWGQCSPILKIILDDQSIYDNDEPAEKTDFVVTHATMFCPQFEPIDK